MLTVCHMKKARQPFLPLKSTSLCRMLCCILTVPNPISFMTVLEEGVWDESHAFSFFLRSALGSPDPQMAGNGNLRQTCLAAFSICLSVQSQATLHLRRQYVGLMLKGLLDLICNILLRCQSISEKVRFKTDSLVNICS